MKKKNENNIKKITKLKNKSLTKTKKKHTIKNQKKIKMVKKGQTLQKSGKIRKNLKKSLFFE